MRRRTLSASGQRAGEGGPVQLALRVWGQGARKKLRAVQTKTGNFMELGEQGIGNSETLFFSFIFAIFDLSFFLQFVRQLGFAPLRMRARPALRIR